MRPHERAEVYLIIPPRYGVDLGGLWWSSNRDAIERRDGTTLAVVDEVRAVLLGALADAPVPPFAFVLNLLHLMKRGGAGADPLRAAFEATRGTAARGRNAGLLIAELCRPLPHAAGRLTSVDIDRALQFLRSFGSHCPSEPGEEPPLTRSEFEQRIFERLAQFDHATLVHWFTHGCGPSGAGARLAKQVESLPERVARLLAHMRRRPRLVGAAALVPALDAALALPPRGHPPEALPVGGYCDVTTRGDPGRLLPGQFALDPAEFVRRFAANELLYFQREEPQAAVRPERVIVLDQGVRTWGSVRHALTAAALALLRVNAKRCSRARLFLTSTPEPIDLADPALTDLNRVADRLEASDLTPNPNDALIRAIQEPGPARVPRDVILLTHDRNVRDPATRAGLIRRSADRVFSLSVSETGAAELSEWVEGGVVPVRSFRVDLSSAEAACCEPDAPPVQARAADGGEWSGDVEPVPFPFRPGLVTEPQMFGFDADGDWLVIGGRDGILHGLALDGTPPAVLPRPYRTGVVLKQVEALLGVTGGVVVCGRMALEDESPPSRVTTSAGRTPVLSSGASEPVGEQAVAAHYDRATRRVTLHVLGPVAGAARWSAHPDLDCIAVRTAAGGGCAHDLATLGRYPSPGHALVSRARLAWDRSAAGASPYEVPIYDDLPPESDRGGGAPFLQRLAAGCVALTQSPGPFTQAAPQRDGKPMLAGAELQRAQLAGDVLALTYARNNERRLLLLRWPHCVVLGETAHPVRNTFTLSPDGRMLARRDVARAVAVSGTSDPARTVATAGPATLHDALAVDLVGTPFQLTITIGGYQHTFRLEACELAYKARWELSTKAERTRGTSRHRATAHDSTRFPPMPAAHTRLLSAVVDRLGQVLLFRGTEGPLVAAFAVRRERAAAWIPGVFWGDPRLIGGPATPDAARAIGRAILAAGGE